MKDSLDSNTRIKLKYLWDALDMAICLQRRHWWGWKTVSWIYPSLVEQDSCEKIKEWLFWREEYLKKEKLDEIQNSQKEIGKRIMSSCKVEFSTPKE